MNDKWQFKHATKQIINSYGNHVVVVGFVQGFEIPKYVQQNGVQVKASNEQDEKIERNHIEKFTVDGRESRVVDRFI